MGVSENLAQTLAVYGQDGTLSTPLISTFGYHDFDVMDETIITDYAERLVNLLVEQYELSDGFQGSIVGEADQMQELEYVLNDMLTAFFISSAVGAQLDTVGSIVGETRQNRSDDEYRDGIYFRIFVNNSSGEIEVIQEFTRYVVNGGTFAFAKELFPAKIAVLFDAVTIPSNLRQLIDEVAAGGVKILPQWTTSGGFTFGFAGEGGIPALDFVRGFDEPGSLVAYESGKFTELIS